jgi:fructuronate reductase
VIEDCFVGGARPRWEDAGAELVGDVAPFEAMKLRLLNGTHSALAYLGFLGGHETIGDCVADPVYRRFVEGLWRDEIIPVTTAPPGTDLAAYAARLLDRYDNPAIRHRTWQIAMDGSQKLPQRLLGTVQAALRQGRTFPRLALAVAAWMIYVGGVDERGQIIDVRDPLLPELRRALEMAGSGMAERVAALLSVASVFRPELALDTAFRSAVTDACEQLLAVGARRAVAACNTA